MYCLGGTIVPIGTVCRQAAIATFSIHQRRRMTTHARRPAMRCSRRDAVGFLRCSESSSTRGCVVWRNQAALLFSALLLTLGATSVAAQSNSSITGVVRDATGGVLPGVTVEVNSPVLIDK